MTSMNEKYGHVFGYWKPEQMMEFLVEHSLVITDGMGEDDEVAITPKGEEVYKVLLMLLLLEGKIEGIQIHGRDTDGA